MHANYCPVVTATLARRFVPSHQIEIVDHGAKYPMEFPVLKAVPAKEHAWLLQEGQISAGCVFWRIGRGPLSQVSRIS